MHAKTTHCFIYSEGFHAYFLANIRRMAVVDFDGGLSQVALWIVHYLQPYCHLIAIMSNALAHLHEQWPDRNACILWHT